MSHSIFKKIRSDLMQRKGRSLLTLLGLCIGLWGVASVAVAWFVLGHDLTENFTRTNPPSIAMRLQGNATIDVAKIGLVEGIDQLESRPVISGRAEIIPGRWMPILFMVVEDFGAIDVAKIFPQKGALPPPVGTVMLERNSLFLGNFYRTRLPSGGDRHSGGTAVPAGEVALFDETPLNIKLPGGTQLSAAIAGTVHDPAQAPSTQEQLLYGYVTRETANLWTGGDFLNRILATSSAKYETEAAVRQTGARLEARLREMGYEIDVSNYPSTTEHIHQFQMNSILFLLTGLGVLSLLMSLVLIVNLINGILTNQIRQIGILKAIGASQRKVTAIYLGGMAILGVVASLIAIPFAVKSGYVVSNALSGFLNFDVLTTELPLSFILTLAAIGILFPVFIALFPIRRWVNVTVVDALQHFGASSKDESGAVIERLSLPLSINARMGVRNAFRRPQRLMLTAATLGAGILIFMVALNMRSSLLHTAEVETQHTRYDVAIVFDQPLPVAKTSFLSIFPMVERVETWKTSRVTTVNENGVDGEVQTLMLVPTGSQAKQPVILRGVWLDQATPGGAVVNQRFQNLNPGLSVGSKVLFRLEGNVFELPIAGVVKEFGAATLYMRDADYRALVPTTDRLVRVGLLTLKQPNEQNLALLMKGLEIHADMEGVGVSAIISAKRASRVIYGHIDVIVKALYLVALLMVLVGSLGMASGISTSVVERTREIGILRAIGGKPRAIRTILVSESMVMALIGWLLALALAQPFSRFLSDYFGTALVEYPFDYMGSREGIYFSLAIAIVLAALATIAPARLAYRYSAKEAIAYE